VTKLLIAAVAVVLCTVCANLLLKIGATGGGSGRVLFGLLSWKSVLGFAFYVAAALFYAWILKWVPLHLAQSIAAAQFIGVILASRWVLAEQIDGTQWLGVGFIAAGIAIAGWSYRPS
jgi:drug/metabolite transporter (DMT)-like permease